MKLVSTTNANGKVFIVKMLETLIIMMQISALTFNCNGSGSESRSSVILSTPEIISICPGENLHFTCSTNRIFIEWKVTILGPETLSRTKLVSNVSPTSMLLINGIEFSITRNSSTGSDLLISTISVANVAADLNGTKVNCTSIGSLSSDKETLLTTVHVIRADMSQPSPPELIHILVVHYETDNIIVMLDWAPENGVSYNVTSVPLAGVAFNGSTSVQLTLLYNTQYNVSILATLCGQSNTAIAVHRNLDFAKCSYPRVEELGVLNIMTVTDDPALEGTNATFSCPPGLVLMGSNTSTCMGNGQWDPHPGSVICEADCGTPILAADHSIVLMYNLTLEGSLLMFWCEESPYNVVTSLCHRNASWYPNPSDEDCSINMPGSSTTIPGPVLNLNTVAIAAILSSVTLFIIVAFVIGFACGCSCQKYKQSHRHPSSNVETNQTSELTPIYAEAMLPAGKNTSTEQEEQNLDMTKNVAYGPLKLSAHAHTD